MNHKIDSTGTAAVATDYYWLPIDENTPRGVKMNLINRAAGVTHIGVYLSSDKYYTHWAPLPTFKEQE